jgi:sugar/nucleoside kinase (ribokinase family)
LEFVKMARHPIAVAAGHICLDISPDLSGNAREIFEKTFLPGRLIKSGPLSYAPGGSVSNTGLALHKLGIQTRLEAKIGNDQAGRILRQVIASHGKGLSGDLQVNAGESTSYSVIINYPGADRIFIHDPGANDSFTSADIPAELLQNADLFHFGYPPVMRSVFVNQGRELVRIFRKAKEMGLITSLDMATPDSASEAGRADWHEILSRVLPFVDIFMPSAEEVLFMLHHDLYQQLSDAPPGLDLLAQLSPKLLSSLGDELIRMGAGIIGLKLGSRGLYLRTARAPRLQFLDRIGTNEMKNWESREFWAPCYKVNVVSTTGSGDATIAGFLASLLNGCPLTECIRMAVAVGACSVEAEDGISGIRPWAETQSRLTSGWQQQLLLLNEVGWDLNKATNLWNGPFA